jgi:pyruvate dehydrogenase E1 component beta subunit
MRQDCRYENPNVNCRASSNQSERAIRVRRLGYAPTSCPPTPGLEALFYPSAQRIAAAARDLVENKQTGWMPAERADLREIEFKGPF